MQNITAGDGVQAWWNAGDTGKGVDVAVIDTGVAPVAGLDAPGKVINGPDLSLESQNPSLQYLDTNGHGTFMAGLIAGNDGQPGGYRGVAPDARIVSLKVGVADGGADVSQVIAAIDWVVQHRNDNGMNIRVINLSYGTNSTQPYNVDPLAYAVEQAWKAGIVVVAAAGNSGYQNGASARARRSGVRPADPRGRRRRHDGDGACRRTTRSRPFSAGARLQQRLPRAGPDRAGRAHAGAARPRLVHRPEQPGRRSGDRYFRGSGTSEATAFVSGAVADLLQRYPQLTPDQVKAMLITSCDKLSLHNWKQQGCGELDMSRLLAAPPLRTLRAVPPRSSTTRSRAAPARSRPSRGSDHISLNGVVLQGEQDIFGKPFNSAAIAALEAAGQQLVGRQLERLAAGRVARGAARAGAVRAGVVQLVGQLLERVAAGRVAPGAVARGAARPGRAARGAARAGVARAGAAAAGRVGHGLERAGADA